MKTDQEILDGVVLKVSEILDITVGDIDKTKFIYLYTLLYNMMGQGPDGDANMRHWMKTYNNHLGFCPVNELENRISEIISYLESFL
jgi:hypothetical protein